MSIAPGSLQLENVSFAIGERTLVRDVSLSVAPGEMIGLIGPNGAGKSSLLRTIYRTNRPSSGRVTVNGENIWQRPASWVARHVGAVLQDMPAEFPLTVRDVIAMGRSAHKRLLEADSAHDRALIEAAIDLLQLRPLETRAFRTLSGGERQRTLVARALVQQPAVLVLDEPTNHLDIHHQLQLLRFVRSLGITVVAALHDLNLAAMFCDRIMMLHQGEMIATGAPEAVLTEENLTNIFRIEATLVRNPRTNTIWVMPA
ncbi:ABC transporter ATP-binding protein [Paradevosia shaoguanensis]|uniref:ABC transporter ATP-binding protein n=1 Tax=Paradevosia shaoguanensis TaxID=1335043 RepID=A0AA41QLU2_9HYPH|nr:ABC transporter ATP-binding protein [Paradevosia shaoguanensis]MCF1742763.1 ABC transporter ATP-binding protein [Paradevosia shaoguanensis]MCI0127246.1 ABC transporter ATP-binding protein [Paradevosia shaoguanensis]